MREVSISQRLEKEINQLTNLEELLEKGRGNLFVGDNSYSIILSSQNAYKEELLGMVRAIKGLALLSLNLPDNKYREKLQRELLEIIHSFNQMLRFNSLPPLNSSTVSNQVYGFRFRFTFDNSKKSFVANLEYQNINTLPAIWAKILGFQGLAEEALAVNSDVVAQVESYNQFLQEKLVELHKVKKNLEDFIKEKSLEEFSNRFKEEAEKIPIKTSMGITGFFILLTVIAIICLIREATSPANWQTFLAKLTIVTIFGGISIYLLRYTVRLIERKQEYHYKALTLSTFPALNFFLENDKNRYELIKTLILENQRLQTLSSKEESLPIEELVKLLSVIKSSK